MDTGGDYTSVFNASGRALTLAGGPPHLRHTSSSRATAPATPSWPTPHTPEHAAAAAQGTALAHSAAGGRDPDSHVSASSQSPDERTETLSIPAPAVGMAARAAAARGTNDNGPQYTATQLFPPPPTLRQRQPSPQCGSPVPALAYASAGTHPLQSQHSKQRLPAGSRVRVGSSRSTSGGTRTPSSPPITSMPDPFPPPFQQQYLVPYSSRHTTPPPGISSEVSYLSPSGQRPAIPSWRPPPPPAVPYVDSIAAAATSVAAGALVPAASHPAPAAELFGTASEAVSTLEMQYRAAMKQLDVVQGMYARLSDHNEGLGYEFNCLRSQLEVMQNTISFGVYNEVRRVKSEMRSARQYVDLLLRDFAQYLDVMIREVMSSVSEALAEATGQNALLPYYNGSNGNGSSGGCSLQSAAGMRARTTAVSVASAAPGPRGVYQPDRWLRALTPASQQRRRATSDGDENEEGRKENDEQELLQGMLDEEHAAGGCFVAPGAPSTQQPLLGSWRGNAEGFDDRKRAAAAAGVAQNSSSSKNELAEVRRQLVLAEGKCRVAEQDGERRVQQLRESFQAREATLVLELTLLRRALGMPTEDLPQLTAAVSMNGDSVNGAVVAAVAHPQAPPSRTLPYESSLASAGSATGLPAASATSAAEAGTKGRLQSSISEDDQLVHSSIATSPDDASIPDTHHTADSEATATNSASASASASATANALALLCDRAEGRDADVGAPMRMRYAPLLFNSEDSRAVEKRVLAAVAQARHRRSPRRPQRRPKDAVGFEEAAQRALHAGGGNYDEYDEDCNSSHIGRGSAGLVERGDRADGSHTGTCQQRWQRQQPLHPNGRSVRHGTKGAISKTTVVSTRSGVHQADRYSRNLEKRLTEAAERLLAQATASSGTQHHTSMKARPQANEGQHTATAMTLTTRPPLVAARLLPEQERREVQRRANGKLIPSSQLTRPVAPSDVSTVAQGLWAEQLLAQRGLS